MPLHLIGRLGFRTDDRSLRRAGLDYWPAVEVRRHVDLEAFEAAHGGRVYCLSTRASVPYTQARFRPGDALLFGGESRGLPASALGRHAGRALTIPMPGGKVRSLNLATAVGIVLYEALRQLRGLVKGARRGRSKGARSAPPRSAALRPFALVAEVATALMTTVASLPTLDDLRRHVLAVLCAHDQLDPAQTPLQQQTLLRTGRVCGLFFQAQGPRQVRSYAVWAGEEGRILFYDSTGRRFAETRLSEAPDPQRLAG